MSFLLTRSYVITDDGFQWITPSQHDALKKQIDDEDEDCGCGIWCSCGQ